MPPTLSQNEVDALMAALQDGKIDTDSDGGIDSTNLDVKPYDMTSRDRIVRGRMPTLDVIHGRLAARFARRLGNLFRQEVELTSESAMPMKLGEFLSYQPMPACLNLITLAPLQGSALVCIQPELFFSILDVVFGGPGFEEEQSSAQPIARDFTPIELEFAAQIIHDFSEDMSFAWAEVHPLTPKYLHTVMSPDHVSIGTPSDVMMTTSFQLRVLSLEGKIDVALPYASLEPIKPRLLEQHMEETTADRNTWKERLLEAFGEVPLTLRFDLGTTGISLSDLMRLNPGDIVRLDRKPGTKLPLRIGGRIKAWADPLEVSGNLGFEFQEWNRNES